MTVRLSAVSLTIGGLNLLGVVFVDQTPGNVWLVIPFLIGCASAEISVVATVCGLARGNGIQRISISLAVLLFWLTTYLLGIKILDNRVPLELILAVAIVSLVSAVLYQLPIAIYTLATGNVLLFESNRDETPGNQFQIKHLLVATTVFAVLIAATKLVVDNSRFFGGSVPWWEVVFFFATFILIAGAVLIPAIIIVFDEKRRFSASCVATLTILVFGPLLAFIGMSISFQGPGLFSDPQEFFEEVYPGTLLFILGNLIASMLLLWLLNCLGFHLTKLDKRTTKRNRARN